MKGCSDMEVLFRHVLLKERHVNWILPDVDHERVSHAVVAIHRTTL